MAQGSQGDPLSEAVAKVKDLITGEDDDGNRTGPPTHPRPPEAPNAAAYQQMTLEQLRDLAAERHLTGRWDMTKDELAVTLAGDWESYDQLTVEELRDLAAKREVAGRSDMDKEQLIEALSLEARTR